MLLVFEPRYMAQQLLSHNLPLLPFMIDTPRETITLLFLSVSRLPFRGGILKLRLLLFLVVPLPCHHRLVECNLFYNGQLNLTLVDWISLMKLLLK